MHKTFPLISHLADVLNPLQLVTFQEWAAIELPLSWLDVQEEGLTFWSPYYSVHHSCIISTAQRFLGERTTLNTGLLRLSEWARMN
jgi:hypothetical protein